MNTEVKKYITFKNILRLISGDVCTKPMTGISPTITNDTWSNTGYFVVSSSCHLGLFTFYFRGLDVPFVDFVSIASFFPI